MKKISIFCLFLFHSIIYNTDSHRVNKRKQTEKCHDANKIMRAIDKEKIDEVENRLRFPTEDESDFSKFCANLIEVRYKQGPFFKLNNIEKKVELLADSGNYYFNINDRFQIEDTLENLEKKINKLRKYNTENNDLPSLCQTVSNKIIAFRNEVIRNFLDYEGMHPQEKINTLIAHHYFDAAMQEINKIKNPDLKSLLTDFYDNKIKHTISGKIESISDDIYNLKMNKNFCLSTFNTIFKVIEEVVNIKPKNDDEKTQAKQDIAGTLNELLSIIKTHTEIKSDPILLECAQKINNFIRRLK